MAQSIRNYFLIALLCIAWNAAAALSTSGTRHVTGRVIDMDSVQLYGARVSMYLHANDSAPEYVTTTDINGRFLLENIPRLINWLRIDYPGFESRYSLVPSGTTDSIIDLGTIKLTKLPTLATRIRWNISALNQAVGNINLHFGWRTMGEIAVGFGDYIEDLSFRWNGSYVTEHWLRKYQVGSEFNFSTRKPLIGPKISFDVTVPLAAAGWSIIYYTDFDKGSLYFRPRVGISIGSYCLLMFSYNIPIMRNYMWDRINHFNFSIEVPILNRNSDKASRYYKLT